jgi:hypothetical protein
MSVRPVAFNADGSIDVVYDETGHSGTIAAADVQWSKNMDGSDNHNFIVLVCPDGCGGASTHPVGGGAAPAQVQEMFVRKVDSEGCVCDEPMTRSTDAAIDHVKGLVEAMDGSDRWQVDEEALAAALSA